MDERSVPARAASPAYAGGSNAGKARQARASQQHLLKQVGDMNVMSSTFNVLLAC